METRISYFMIYFGYTLQGAYYDSNNFKVGKLPRALDFEKRCHEKRCQALIYIRTFTDIPKRSTISTSSSKDKECHKERSKIW